MSNHVHNPTKELPPVKALVASLSLSALGSLICYESVLCAYAAAFSSV